MIKEIQYGGYSTEPSEYECADGQLDLSLNLLNENGHLKPVFQPSEQAVLPDGCKIVYIHKTNMFTHYILLNTNTNKIYWIDESVITEAEIKPVSSSIISNELAKTNPNHELHSFGETKINNVNGIGNTLIVLTSYGMHYFLWKGESDGYLYLGTHLPELPISFGLLGEVVDTEQFKITFDKILAEDLEKEFSEENKEKITSQVLAKVNKFIADNSTRKGKFIYPFLVRYAYRLYDSSLTMHSSPVLMICSSDLAPQVVTDSFRTKTAGYNFQEAMLRVFGVLHTLDYAVIHPSRIDILKKWKDIVRSVDVFVSKPIYTYDQNGKCERFAEVDINDCYCVCKHTNQNAALPTDIMKPLYMKRQMFSLYATTFSTDINQLKYNANRLIITRKSKEQIKADIRSCSQFYLLKSINVDDLKTERTPIEVPEDYLQSLTTREVMTDDYDSHDTLIPGYSFAYNSRLNIADIKKRLYDLFNTGALFCYANGEYMGGYVNDNVVSFSTFVYIKQDGRDIVVDGETYNLPSDSPKLFLYYPNVNAYKAVIRRSGITDIEIPLEQHDFLNGAFYFDGWENKVGEYSSPIHISNDDERTISIPNKIYTSEVNNPFLFPVLGINTVGTGSIIGISAAAKALSQGQFGQFPLYAFTTEGVWALEVSSTGTYSARQPITRDVCINPNSITQLDSSVLFVTERGIMLISGSQTQCITDNIFAENPFNVLELPYIEELHEKIGHAADACLPIQPLLGFLKDCQMVYDYVHQRIFVFNPTKKNGTLQYTYAYVFSLKSQRWGMVFSNLLSSINSYPDALAMTHDNKLISFSKTDETESKGMFITRPLKMDVADIHKTISTLIQRGHFKRGDVATVLYGSRDLYKWNLVWSSKDHYLRGFRGTPYKYFRIAGITSLTDGKSVFGASVNFEQRHTNQLR